MFSRLSLLATARHPKYLIKSQATLRPNKIALRQPAVLRSSRTFCSNRYSLETSVILERTPVAVELPEWEKKYGEFKKKMEIEQLEMQEEDAKKKVIDELKFRQKKTKVSKGERELGGGGIDVYNARDGSKKKKKKYKRKAFPFITPADHSNDRKSLYRKLTTQLYLLVKNEKGEWNFPRGEHAQEDGDSLRMTAERQYSRFVQPDSIEIYWAGNCPIGHYKPPSSDITSFFFKCTFVNGNIAFHDTVKDYLWLSRSELKEYFPEDFHNYLTLMLMDEEVDNQEEHDYYQELLEACGRTNLEPPGILTEEITSSA